MPIKNQPIGGSLAKAGVWLPVELDLTDPEVVDKLRGPEGKQGSQGQPGRAPTVQEVSEGLLAVLPIAAPSLLRVAIADHLKENPPPRGERGVPGPEGKQGDRGVTGTMPPGSWVLWIGQLIPAGYRLADQQFEPAVWKALSGGRSEVPKIIEKV